MQMNELKFIGPQPIDGYGTGFFRVGGQVCEGPLLLHAKGLIPWSGDLADTDPIVSLCNDIDVLLFGWGAEPQAIPLAFREAIEAAGPGLEPMATASACRTYNVLLAEGRRVAAALLPVT